MASKLGNKNQTKSARELHDKRPKGQPRPKPPTNTITNESLSALEVHYNEITTELRHKQRLVAQINNQTSNIDETYTKELANRDAYIDELNARILDLEQVIKEKGIKRKNKDLELDKLYKEINDMLTDNHSMQNRSLMFETMLKAEKDKNAKQKEEAEILHEVVGEELEELKREHALKEQKMTDTR
jgi:hypothetical protein